MWLFLGIKAKETEKIKKYFNLWIKVAKMWDVQAIPSYQWSDVVDNIELKFLQEEKISTKPSIAETCVACHCKYSSKDGAKFANFIGRNF